MKFGDKVPSSAFCPRLTFTIILTAFDVNEFALLMKLGEKVPFSFLLDKFVGYIQFAVRTQYIAYAAIRMTDSDKECLIRQKLFAEPILSAFSRWILLGRTVWGILCIKALFVFFCVTANTGNQPLPFFMKSSRPLSATLDRLFATRVISLCSNSCNMPCRKI